MKEVRSSQTYTSMNFCTEFSKMEVTYKEEKTNRNFCEISQITRSL